MTEAPTWRGRRGAVLLGPTEDRVARYLVDRTRHGRVVIRTADLVTTLRLSRSEAYRVTARLRVLGLFGIRNDRGGTLGGRWYWRTAIAHDGAGLNATRHRLAWGRILAAARARVAERLRRVRSPGVRPITPTRPAVDPCRPAAATFRDRFRAAGGAHLLEQWGVT